MPARRLPTSIAVAAVLGSNFLGHIHGEVAVVPVVGRNIPCVLAGEALVHDDVMFIPPLECTGQGEGVQALVGFVWLWENEVELEGASQGINTGRPGNRTTNSQGTPTFKAR